MVAKDGILPDQPIATVGQTTSLENVTFIPTKADPVFQMELIKAGTGERIKVPLKLILTTGGYRVRCKTIPRNASFGFVAAIARARDFPPPGSKPIAGSVFDKNYALKLGGEIDRWYGYGLFDELFKSDRVVVKKVKFEGSYLIDGKTQNLSQDLTVPDVVGDLLKGGIDNSGDQKPHP